MSQERWERIKSLFHAALTKTGVEREELLDRECAGDADLRREIDDLLRARTLDRLGTGGGAKALDSGTSVASTIARPLTEGPGTRVGPYKLLQEIGEGGFGVVFMADQERPVRRRVALKIIKLGMDTRQVVARFEQERQALALMDHPNIAKVFDAGATESGRPYFVMEYVKGDPITEFADAHQLSVRERLHLFIQVCQAVQHAHTKGVIHRDIKPRNVLAHMTDGKPFAKVIDFGIAKATGATLTEKTLFTEHQQLIGTPEYMSPEQAEGSLDIDTRADVYGLGVLLYELLTGATPFDAMRLRSAAFAEMQRIIKEEEPPAPSLRLTRNLETLAIIAASRQADPDKLGALIRGELDWIAMKAIEKDRARRYESPNQLAADVQRHLSGEPVVAAPPGVGYRLRKFVRRHRGPLLAGGAVAAALSVGLAGMTHFYLRAKAETAQKTESLADAVAARDGEQQEKSKAQAAQKEAELQRDEADRQRDLAVFQAYAARVNAALWAIANGDRGTAQSYLSRCPEELRNWEWGLASTVLDQSLRRVALGGTELSITVNPSRSQLIATDGGSHIRMLGLPSLTPLAELRHQCARNTEADWSSATVDLSPDGSRFVTVRGYREASVRLWNADDMVEVAGFTRQDDFYGTIRFSSDSRFLLVLDWEDSTGQVIDADTGRIRATIHDASITEQSQGLFTLDGSQIVISSRDGGGLRVFASSDGSEVQRLEAGRAPIDRLISSPDGSLFLTLDKEGWLGAWDAARLRQLWMIHDLQGAEPVWAPDSTRVAGFHNGWVLVANARTGEYVARCRSGTTGFTTNADTGGSGVIAPSPSLTFSPDSQKLLGLTRDVSDGLCQVWNAETGEEVARLPPTGARMLCHAFSPDSTLLAIGLDDGTIHLLDLAHGTLRNTYWANAAPCRSLAFSSNATTFYSTGGYEGSISEWDANARPVFNTLRPSGSPIPHAVQFTPDSRFILALGQSDGPTRDSPTAVGVEEEAVRYFDAGTGLESRRLEVNLTPSHNDGFYSTQIEVSGDGSKVAVVGSLHDGFARVFDVDTGYPLDDLRWPQFGDDSNHCGVVLGPDFSIAAVWLSTVKTPIPVGWLNDYKPQPVRLVNTKTGEVTHVLRIDGDTPCVPAMNPSSPIGFSPDGLLLAAACRLDPSDMWKSSVVIWSAATGEQLRKLDSASANYPWVERVLFVGDGSRIATDSPGFSANSVSLWNASTGKAILSNSLPLFQGQHWGLSPDVTRLLGCADNWLRVFDLASGVEVAALRVGSVSYAEFSPDGKSVLALRNWSEGSVYDSVPYVQRYAERQRFMRAGPDARHVASSALSTGGQRIQLAAEVIRSNIGLSKEVRELALDELFHERAKRKAMVSSLFERLVFVDDVVAELDSDLSIDPGVREDLIEIARRTGDLK